jgi:hypothetical protein
MSEYWDIPAIAANCCGYVIRLNTKRLEQNGASLSLSILAQCLLNGEVLDNGRSTNPGASKLTVWRYLNVGNTRYRDTLETQGKYSLSPGEGTCGSGGSVGSYSLLSREKKGVRILPRGNSPRGPGPRDYSPCNKPPPSHARISLWRRYSNTKGRYLL